MCNEPIQKKFMNKNNLQELFKTRTTTPHLPKKREKEYGVGEGKKKKMTNFKFLAHLCLKFNFKDLSFHISIL